MIHVRFTLVMNRLFVLKFLNIGRKRILCDPKIIKCEGEPSSDSAIGPEIVLLNRSVTSKVIGHIIILLLL